MIFRLYNPIYIFTLISFFDSNEKKMFPFKHSGFFVDFGAGMRERKNKFQMGFLIAPLLLKNCAFTVRQRCAKEKFLHRWTWADENSQSLRVLRMCRQHRTWKNWSKVGMTTAIEKRFPIPHFLEKWNASEGSQTIVFHIAAALVLFDDDDSISCSLNAWKIDSFSTEFQIHLERKKREFQRSMLADMKRIFSIHSIKA